MVRFVAALVFCLAIVVPGLRASADSSQPPLPLQPAVRPVGMLIEAMKLSPCVANMGEHWAALKNMPIGPIYGVWHDRPVFTELMVTQTQLQNGFSYANIRALPGYTIDHIDFQFEPHGHPGLPVPHYDIHAYYVSPAVQATICPDGIPNTAMKPMNILKR